MTLQTASAELVKDAPVIAVPGALFLGVPVNTWVIYLGLAYGVLRLVWFGVEAYWKWKDRHNGKSQ